MKFSFLSRLSILIISLMTLTACGEKEHLVTLHTDFGDIKLVLFDDTPEHKMNFLKLAESGKLDSTNFHRIIQGFMIQGGDINAKKGLPKEEQVNYRIPAEINNKHFHRKGAVAAARQGDNVNPERESSGSQFYIVDGKEFSNEELEKLEQNRNLNNLYQKFSKMIGWTKYKELRDEVRQLQMARDSAGTVHKILESKPLVEKELGKVQEYHYTEYQKEVYATEGGSPHLDGEYTVFGQVVDGFDVIDQIAAQPTGAMDRPVEPIYMTVTIEEVPKKKITKEYGYEFPEE